MLMLLVPQVIKLIIERHGLSEREAADVFYNSRVYALLEDEETKLWHYSALTLFNMYGEERETGKITFPEEV
jgi:hypothetical protein